MFGLVALEGSTLSRFLHLYNLNESEVKVFGIKIFIWIKRSCPNTYYVPNMKAEAERVLYLYILRQKILHPLVVMVVFRYQHEWNK